MANVGNENQPANVSKVSPTPSAPVPTPSTKEQDSVETNAIPDGKVTLTLNAIRGNSYIDVIVDGTRVIKGSLFQGDVKNFEGTKAISIYLSNPAGVDVTVDGQLLPPLGGQNEEVRRTFR